MLLVPQPYGEILDRLTILGIKCARITGPRRGPAAKWREALLEAWARSGLPELESIDEYQALYEVNAALWDVEDALRVREHAQAFDEGFVALARDVYRLNDRRAALKRAVDERLGSPFTEPKAYSLQTGT